MIISIPTSTGMFSFCLNAPLLKLAASVLLALMLACGYCIMQFATFVLNASPEQFLRIVLFTLILVGSVLAARYLHSRKQVAA